MTGLPIAGSLIPVPGLTIVAPASMGGPSWARLSGNDGKARTTPWVRQIIVHTTGGRWPQQVIKGAGLGGHAREVLDDWFKDPKYSGAHIVVDYNGAVVCCADLASRVAYHAEGSNGWSIGIEMSTTVGGGIYTATLDATALLVPALCEHFPVPTQINSPWLGKPIARMESGIGETRHNLGGPSCCGVFGHRDNTSNRGRGDPGDEIFGRLERAGFEAMDFYNEQDIHLGKVRQAALNARGEALVIDGICGPASLVAMRRQGFSRWRDVV